ncbi:hypothetical protein [Sunxiuqinia sp. sy24]|uniref:hypothetical protein n=1 Tax=Sunxiuqinia sp. sy24 TaxID=3461495 RepID=UPI0040465AF3
MKTISLKIGTFLMLFALMGAGCEKENTIENEDLMPVEVFKFSDFGCENIPWHLKQGYANNHYVITSQQELEKYVEIDCSPQIDFTKYIVILGSKSFTTGATIYSESVEESSSKTKYTITFLTDISTVAIGLSYHVVIKKTLGEDVKNIEVIEYVKQEE